MSSGMDFINYRDFVNGLPAAAESDLLAANNVVVNDASLGPKKLASNKCATRKGSLSSDCVFSLAGANVAFAVSDLFAVQQGIEYEIEIGELGWDITSLTSQSQSVLIYYSVASDGTLTAIANWLVRDFANIPKKYKFTLTNGDIGVCVYLRADSGQTVSFSLKSLLKEKINVIDVVSDSVKIANREKFSFAGQDVTGIQKDIALPASGNYRFEFDTSLWTFNSYTSSSQDLLNVRVVNKDGTQTQIYRVGAGQGVGSIKNSIDFELAANQVGVHIFLRADVGSVASLSLYNSDEDIRIESLEKKVNLANYILKESVSGNGIYSVEKIFEIRGGSEYTISFDKTDWTFNDYTSGSQLIVIVSVLKADNSSRTIYYRRADAGIAGMFSSVSFVTSEDEVYLSISVKADVGKTAKYAVSKNLDNGIIFLGEPNQSGLNDFTKNFIGSGNSVSFIFFTDPHSLLPNTYDWKTAFKKQMVEINEWQKVSPVDFVLCGGDWLTQNTTQEEAVLRLGYASGWMNQNFDNVLQLVGNHDTNYQGVVSSEDSSSGDLPVDTIANLMNRKFGKNYYKHETSKAVIYCFDSGKDSESSMNSYRYEQSKWFASSLIDESKENVIIAVHIITNNSVVQPFAQLLLDIASANNSKGTITIDGDVFDFAQSNCAVKFCIGGHTHIDSNTEVNGIPVVITKNAGGYMENPSFDLVFADFSADKLYLKRIGSGSDREIQL